MEILRHIEFGLSPVALLLVVCHGHRYRKIHSAPCLARPRGLHTTYAPCGCRTSWMAARIT